MNSAQILVIDDEIQIRKLLQITCSRAIVYLRVFFCLAASLA
jgi:hypothetical protein